MKKHIEDSFQEYIADTYTDVDPTKKAYQMLRNTYYACACNMFTLLVLASENQPTEEEVRVVMQRMFEIRRELSEFIAEAVKPQPDTRH